MKNVKHSYFAIQNRKQELTEKEYSSLTENEKCFYQRNLTKKGNYSLNQVEQIKSEFKEKEFDIEGNIKVKLKV